MAKSSYAPNPAKIKVIGLGGGGCNAVTRMVREKIDGVEFFRDGRIRDAEFPLDLLDVAPAAQEHLDHVLKLLRQPRQPRQGKTAAQFRSASLAGERPNGHPLTANRAHGHQIRSFWHVPLQYAPDEQYQLSYCIYELLCCQDKYSDSTIDYSVISKLSARDGSCQCSDRLTCLRRKNIIPLVQHMRPLV